MTLLQIVAVLADMAGLLLLVLLVLLLAGGDNQGCHSGRVRLVHVHQAPPRHAAGTSSTRGPLPAAAGRSAAAGPVTA